MLIPFISSTSTVYASVVNSSGDLRITPLSFGRFSGTAITMAGGLAGGTFTIPTGTDSVQYMFPIAYDATITSIYATFNNYSSFTPTAGSDYYPFVAVATAPVGSFTFTVLQDTVTAASTPFPGGTSSPSGTMLSGNLTGLNVQIPAGTQFMIIGGWYCTGTIRALNQYVYMSGSILLN